MFNIRLLVWGHWVLRPLYVIPIYFNFASWVAPQVWYLEPWYVYVATLGMMLTAFGVPIVGMVFAFVSAWALWGWAGVACVTPIAALECYRWYLWCKIKDAVEIWGL